MRRAGPPLTAPPASEVAGGSGQGQLGGHRGSPFTTPPSSDPFPFSDHFTSVPALHPFLGVGFLALPTFKPALTPQQPAP